MTLRLSQISLALEEDESGLPARVARLLDIPRQRITGLRVVRKGLDARHKSRIVQVFTVDFECDDEDGLLGKEHGNSHLARAPAPDVPEPVRRGRPFRALVTGMGPAGLFAAWRLAQGGARVVLIERGRPVEERLADVEDFWRAGRLDPESNVQFGEGGAGTFSDGKLTTRIGGPWIPLVLQTLVACGAPEEILTQARPHVGTDRLRSVMIRFRRLLTELGVEIRFCTRLDALASGRQGILGGVVSGGEEIPCQALVLACGHSARDTFRMLHDAGVAMEVKAFAVGLRVEHPAPLINRIQWGKPSLPGLPAADYRLSHTNPTTGRGTYSFCMCPGGEVISACSEPGRMVVNGMSRHDRDGAFSNSALVVTVRPGDFPSSHPLAGIDFQRCWEEKAFAAAGGDYRAPAQNLLAFLGKGSGPVRSTVRPGWQEADLREVLPPFAVEEMTKALPCFDRAMPGFLSREATLVGLESRTSSPLRILRGEDGASLSHPGLYPAGEGAGYAGGIVSSAVDGLKAADLILKKMERSDSER
jgi:uncharacterized FAD-dependent dehydrogenase